MTEPWRQRSARAEQIIALLLYLDICVAFCLSAMALSRFGIAYDAPGGNFMHKLHPAALICGIVFLLNIFWRRDPLGYIAAFPQRFPGATIFAGLWVATIVYAVMVQHAPMMPLMDTFFLGFVFLSVYEDLPLNARLRLRVLLHAIFLINGLIGIGEFVTHMRLTPYVTGGKIILHDYRSTALFGHPLLNAGSTAAYMLALIYGGDSKLNLMQRMLLLSIQAVAMIAFGGRSAIVLTVVFGSFRLMMAGVRLFSGEAFDLRAAIGFACVFPFILMGGATAVVTGTLDKLIERFVDDKGSAQARVVMFQLFDDFSLEQLLFGPDPERLAWLQRLYGIEYGIENSWLGLIFQYGILMSFLFVIGFFALLSEFWRRAAFGRTILCLFFLLQVSSAASLSVKSYMFNHFVIILLSLLDRRLQNADAVDAHVPVAARACRSVPI